MCCPTQGWSPSDRQKNRHTQHGKVWREKTSASRVLAALASSPATKALDPDVFPRHSLRHAVYAALLHFGLETATEIHYQVRRVVKDDGWRKFRDSRCNDRITVDRSEKIHQHFNFPGCVGSDVRHRGRGP